MQTVGRAWILSMVAAGCLVLAPAAAAAVIVGGDLTQSPDSDLPATVGNPISGVTVTDAAGLPETGSPISGVLVSARVKTGGDASPSLVVRVLRDQGMFSYFNLAPQIPLPVPALGTAAITGVTGLHHPIGVGDRLGVGYTKTMNFGIAAGGTMGITRYQEVDHPAGTAVTYNGESGGQELLVQGTVEPDADGDTFGDETQDLCPTNAALQGACPVAIPTTSQPLKRKKCKRKKKRGRAAAAKRCKKKKKRAP